jgi:hypothetical protein
LIFSHSRQCRITVITGIACTVLLYSPSVPGPLSVLLEDVYPVVVNIMACRLFRSTKSGAIQEFDISPSVARTVSQRTHLPPMKFAVSLSSAESGSNLVQLGQSHALKAQYDAGYKTFWSLVSVLKPNQKKKRDYKQKVTEENLQVLLANYWNICRVLRSKRGALRVFCFAFVRPNGVLTLLMSEY